jgi:hypothetical protein
MEDMKLKMKPSLKNMKFIILFSLIIFVNLSCSKKRTDVATFEMKPAKPIVINADFTTKDSLGNDITITAPWFHFYVSLSNNSADTVTIVTFTGKITATTSADGSLNYESKEFAFDTTGTLGRSYIKELAPNTVNQSLDIPIYIYGLPKGDGKTFRYSGYFELVGWVGTHDNATARLTTYPIYFTTE